MAKNITLEKTLNFIKKVPAYLTARNIAALYIIAGMFRYPLYVETIFPASIDRT